MMQSRKLPKRLFKSTDVIHAYEHDRMTKGAVKHLERDYIDVLQNIEFALVKQASDHPTIDDAVIDQALALAAVEADPPEDADSRLVSLCKMLESVRSSRTDVSDEVWQPACGRSRSQSASTRTCARRNQLPRFRTALCPLNQSREPGSDLEPPSSCHALNDHCCLNDRGPAL